MRRVIRFLLPLVALSAVGVFSLAAVGSHGSADEATPNMLHAANLPPPGEFVTCNRGGIACFNSDLAFWNAGGLKGGFSRILAQGNYEGFRLVDISNPGAPRTSPSWHAARAKAMSLSTKRRNASC